MGIYIYTLRSATKTVPTTAPDTTKVEIGQFLYGYKPFWRDDRSPVIQSLLRAAGRAFDKLQAKGVELFVKGDWRDGQAVHWAKGPFSTLTEEFVSCPQIGTLAKNSQGRWYLNLLTEQELLGQYPEIGVLHTDEGKKFYFTDRDRNGVEAGLQYPASLNLYQVISNVNVMRRRNWR